MHKCSDMIHTEIEVKYMNSKKVNKALNQLLKGTHMGTSLFKFLQKKLKTKRLRKLWKEMINTLSDHEKILTKLIETYGGEPVDTAGIIGTMTDVLYKMRYIFLSDEKDILELSITSMEQGRKALSAFVLRKKFPNKDIDKIVRTMKKDYEEILYELKRFQLEAQYV